MSNDIIITLDKKTAKTGEYITATANFSMNGYFKIGSNVIFSFTDDNGRPGTNAAFDGKYSRTTVPISIFGDAVVTFTDKFAETGFVVASAGEPPVSSSAPFKFVTNNTGGNGNRYIFFRSKEESGLVSFIQVDDKFQKSSDYSAIPNTNISGSGTFCPIYANGEVILFFVDKYDNFLKKTVYNNEEWSSPERVIKNDNTEILFINQIEKYGTGYQAICTKKVDRIITVAYLGDLTTDNGNYLHDIQSASSLSWASYINRSWISSGDRAFIDAYHAVAPGQNINIYEDFGNGSYPGLHRTRSTDAGNTAEDSGTFAIRGHYGSDDQREDFVFFQFNNQFGIVKETVNNALVDKDLILLRGNTIVDPKVRFFPKEGVSAIFNKDNSHSIFGVDDEDNLLLSKINYNDFVNYTIDVNSVTNIGIKVASSFVQYTDIIDDKIQ